MLAEPPLQIWFADDGYPLAGGTVWYDAPVYLDRDNNRLHVNPVVLDRNGCAIVWANGNVPVKVCDHAGMTVWQRGSGTRGCSNG